MSQVRTSSLYTRTLFTGIVLGVLAALVMIFSNQFMQAFGTAAFNSGNPVQMTLVQAFLFVGSAGLPFSAALISAALVMRYLDHRLADRGE